MRTESDVTKANDAIIDTLNKFLRGELAAVETYGQALERLRDSTFVADLASCRASHEERAELLRQQVVRMGGKPSDSSGPWGGFAKLVEGSAKLFGEKAALAALEEGEDHGLKLYRSESSKLDTVTRDVVERSLLPAQERTHQVMSALKHSFH
jgi:bacterioferritin (cytochrome b1)